ncbi:MAG: PrgI family protein [Clostridia bacterium]|nr:PrgI family protein [Clostridia bacterium]
MGPYNIPRNVSDEGRILFIFTGKSMIYTAVAAGIGFIFYLIINAFGAKMIGMLVVAIFALIGFCIGTFKVPDIGAFAFTKKVGGESIDDVIIRAIRFKKAKNKIYTYEMEEETKDE